MLIFTPGFEDFVKYTALSEPMMVQGVSTGVGIFEMHLEVKEKVIKFKLKNVLCLKTAPFRVFPQLVDQSSFQVHELDHPGWRQEKSIGCPMVIEARAFKTTKFVPILLISITLSCFRCNSKKFKTFFYLFN